MNSVDYARLVQVLISELKFLNKESKFCLHFMSFNNLLITHQEKEEFKRKEHFLDSFDEKIERNQVRVL